MNVVTKFSQRLDILKLQWRKSLVNFTTLKYSTSDPIQEDFITVYKFPYIISASLVNRLKFYHSVLTVTSVPTSVLLSKMSFMDMETVQLLATTGS